jgi:MSHA biogenesis protein MshJ
MNPALKLQWEKLSGKVDNLSLRERAIIFIAAAFLLVTLINTIFLDPLLAQQKKISLQVIQQQEKMKELQADLAALVQAKNSDAHSPIREQITKLQLLLNEGESYLKGRRDKLVPPEKMGELLKNVLSKEERLQMVSLETLPATPLIEISPVKQEGVAIISKPTNTERQIYKHGVKMTVRGSYADILQYLTSLEKLPTQMFWGAAKMSVSRYPTVELTLTLYTLSLDSTWLQV